MQIVEKHFEILTRFQISMEDLTNMTRLIVQHRKLKSSTITTAKEVEKK